MELTLNNIKQILEASTRKHSHLCPRQILGARIGLAGMAAFQLTTDEIAKKRLLIIAETDGCFVDGLIAATGCEFGHRTLRVEDLGKIAATFIDVSTERCLRIAPALDLREKAGIHTPEQPKHYFAQLEAYQIMSETEMFTFETVILDRSVHDIISRPGIRRACENCGEEIINEREVVKDGKTLCRTCAGQGYYHPLGR